jgi:hypothetical protein
VFKMHSRDFTIQPVGLHRRKNWNWKKIIWGLLFCKCMGYAGQSGRTTVKGRRRKYLWIIFMRPYYPGIYLGLKEIMIIRIADFQTKIQTQAFMNSNQECKSHDVNVILHFKAILTFFLCGL